MLQQPLINKLRFFEVFLTILPGLIMAMVSSNDIWLLCCFYSVCGMMPFHFSYNNRLSSIIHAVVIFILSIYLGILLNKTQVLFCLNLILLSLALGYIEFYNQWMKTAVSYLYIGIIYSSFKLQHVNLSHTQDAQILLLSIFSIILGLAFSLKPRPQQSFLFNYNFDNFIYYIKYVIPVAICLLFWQLFNTKEAEWLIWSSLSVFNLEFNQSKRKINYRLRGCLMGVTIGLILSQIIPSNNFLTYCYFTGILISLRTFNNYLVAFTVRCALIILFANHNFIEIGTYRLSNIFIGGVIGLIASWLFDIYLKFLKNNNVFIGNKS